MHVAVLPHVRPRRTVQREMPRWWHSVDFDGEGRLDADSVLFDEHTAPNQHDFILDVLTDDQLAEIDAAWFEIDSDHSGYMDKRELKRLLKVLGIPRNRNIREYLRAMDWNSSGKVEYEEFRLFMAKMMCGDQGHRELNMATELLDVDRDGLISTEVLRYYMTTAGSSPLDEREMAEFLQLCDPHSTGLVSVDAFRSLPCWNTEPLLDQTHTDGLREMVKSRRTQESLRLNSVRERESAMSSIEPSTSLAMGSVREDREVSTLGIELNAVRLDETSTHSAVGTDTNSGAGDTSRGTASKEGSIFRRIARRPSTTPVPVATTAKSLTNERSERRGFFGTMHATVAAARFSSAVKRRAESVRADAEEDSSSNLSSLEGDADEDDDVAESTVTPKSRTSRDASQTSHSPQERADDPAGSMSAGASTEER